MDLVYNLNSKISVQNMEAKGYIVYEDFIQLSQQYPEIYEIMAELLSIKPFQVLSYIKRNKVETTTYLPLLLRGLQTKLNSYQK